MSKLPIGLFQLVRKVMTPATPLKMGFAQFSTSAFSPTEKTLRQLTVEATKVGVAHVNPVSLVRGSILANRMGAHLGRPGAESGIWVVEKADFNAAVALWEKRIGPNKRHDILNELLGVEIPKNEQVFMFEIREPGAHTQTAPKSTSAGANDQFEEGGRTKGGLPELIIDTAIPLLTWYMPVDGEDLRAFENVIISLFASAEDEDKDE